MQCSDQIDSRKILFDAYTHEAKDQIRSLERLLEDIAIKEKELERNVSDPKFDLIPYFQRNADQIKESIQELKSEFDSKYNSIKKSMWASTGLEQCFLSKEWNRIPGRLKMFSHYMKYDNATKAIELYRG